MTDYDEDELRRERRRTEALETIAEQLEIQNGVLLELVIQQERTARAVAGLDPDDFYSDRKANYVNDRVLELVEKVDLEEAHFWADQYE